MFRPEQIILDRKNALDRSLPMPVEQLLARFEPQLPFNWRDFDFSREIGKISLAKTEDGRRYSVVVNQFNGDVTTTVERPDNHTNGGLNIQKKEEVSDPSETDAGRIAETVIVQSYRLFGNETLIYKFTKVGEKDTKNSLSSSLEMKISQPNKRKWIIEIAGELEEQLGGKKITYQAKADQKNLDIKVFCPNTGYDGQPKMLRFSGQRGISGGKYQGNTESIAPKISKQIKKIGLNWNDILELNDEAINELLDRINLITVCPELA
jgi:hypothetical protein